MNQFMTQTQINAIGRELKRRIIAGEAEELTTVVMLISMAKAGRISPSHIQHILYLIYEDLVKVLAVLIEAQVLVNEEMVDSIIDEVKAAQ